MAWPFSKPLHGRDKANALVASYGSHLGATDAMLDKDNDRSFGECGFHYDAKKDILEGRVFVAKAYLTDNKPEKVANFHKVARALNDPKIGGMFEQGGGHFILDEQKEIYFLIKEFSVETTSRELRQQMDDLLNLAATWRMRWFVRVARITQGRELAPTEPVTRKNPGPRQ
jgi:hypothetical protein